MGSRPLKAGERTVQLSFRVPSSLAEKIRETALDERKPDAQVIRETMEERYGIAKEKDEVA